MAVIVTTTPIRLHNRTVDPSGVYVIKDADMVVFRVAASSSGNSHPLVRTFVDWGDGQKDSTDFRSVGRPYQYQHVYESLGNYTITVTAENTDGELSAVTTDVIVPLRVVAARPPEKRNPRKWAGLSLPGATIREGYSAVQDVYTPITVGLAVDAIEGETTIRVDSAEEQFYPESFVIITQAGRLITTARVRERVDNSNLIHLDTALFDDYTSTQGGQAGAATVELRRESIRRGMNERTVPVVQWYFPTTFDAVMVKGSLRMLFNTALEERVFRLGYGVRLPEIPFEPNDDITFDLLRSDIVEAVTREEPRASVRAFQLTRNNNDINGKCVVQLADESESFELEFAINRTS